jgi:glycosyltransferase involved in cell wall biosynthesis
VRATFLANNPELPAGLRWIEKIRGLRTLARAPVYLSSVWRELASVDLVHLFAASYSSFMLTGAPAWALAKLRGKAVLIHYHSARNWEALERSLLMKAVLRRSDAVVVPSEYLQRRFASLAIATAVIPNVIADAQFVFRVRDPLSPRLLCTRGLYADYGIDLLLRTFAKVQARFPQASLCLVGDGPMRPQLEALVRELKLANVEFRGRVRNQEISRCYEQADIFVNASLVDNAPLSILEAWASGSPVVTSAAGGIPDMAEDGATALLARVGDAEQLAQQVLRLLEDPALARRLSENGRRRLDEHRWTSVRELWISAYASSLEAPSTAAR